jgi:hypothetical protein
MATYMGREMAALISGTATRTTWDGLKFKAIPGHFGKPWFLPLAGAYYRLKDVVR